MPTAFPHVQALRAQWADEMIKSLAAALMDLFSHSHDKKSIEQVPHLVLSTVCRAGWPGSLLSAEMKSRYQARITLLAKDFVHAHHAAAIFGFAQKATQWLLESVPEQRLEEAITDTENKTTLAWRVQTLVEQEQRLSGGSTEEIASRVARRLWQEKQQEKRRYVRVDLPAADPLRQVLNLPSDNALPLPKNDLRAHILGLQSSRGEKNSPLFEVLRAAAPFAGQHMRLALGEDIFRICQPVGYADRARTIVLAKVPNSAVLHELSFRKLLIIARLQTIPGLEHIKDVRFQVGQQD